jgi:hypothetical protein
MKFSEKDALWLGGIVLVALTAYALYTHASDQEAINSTPALTTAPNTIVSSPVVTQASNVTMPVYAPVSTPDLGYQVSPMPADFANLSYQLPTMPDITVPQYDVPNLGISAPSPSSPLDTILDPLHLF